MSLEPFGWNVVVVGYWNLAILTPAGIARRILGLPEGTNIEVDVPLDGVAPVRVRNGNLLVTPDRARLTIDATDCSFQTLQAAREAAARATRGLPETPVSAAGFNVRYRISDPHDQPLLRLLQSEADARISDEGFEIRGRSFSRTLAHQDGRVRVDCVREDNGPTVVSLNLERLSSSVEELVQWLEMPSAAIRNINESVLVRIFGVDATELPNEPDRRPEMAAV